jgi:hypothetical protein
VLETTRRKEAEVKKDTLEQLEVFRRRQEEAERKLLEAENTTGPLVEDSPQWIASGRKRKKSEKDGALLKGVKLRRASTGAGAAAEAKKVPVAIEEGKHPDKGDSKSSSTALAAKAQPSTSTDAKKAVATKPIEATKATTAAAPAPQLPKAVGLSLGYASSDEDD